MSFFAPGEHHEAPTVGGDVIASNALQSYQIMPETVPERYSFLGVLIGSPFDGQAESPLNAPEKISSAWP